MPVVREMIAEHELLTRVASPSRMGLRKAGGMTHVEVKVPLNLWLKRLAKAQEAGVM